MMSYFQPINEEEAVDFYDKRYQQGYMEEWDQEKKNKVKEILLLLNLPEYGRALDFGCGNGVFTNIIKEVLPKWEVYGVEISETAIVNASKKFPLCNFFSVKDGLNYNKQFDFLFSHHVIEHVQDLSDTYGVIDSYLKATSYQFHILPCGNKGSYEYNIASLIQEGIEKNNQNRFFFEEPGHLRRLTSKQFETYEKEIGFKLTKQFFANQTYGAINWITKSSPRFVKRLTDTSLALNADSRKQLTLLRKKLLPLTYLQFPYSKYWMLKAKWNKQLMDYIKIAALFIPAMVSKPFYLFYVRKAADEWKDCKANENGSEMFLFFERKVR